MIQLSRIPLAKNINGSDLLRGNPLSSIVLSSASANWPNVVVEEHHYSKGELDDLMYLRHVLSVNVGEQFPGEIKKDGRFHHVSTGTGTITVTPAYRLFSRRLTGAGTGVVKMLYIALDPAFVSQTAAAMELAPNGVELIEQRRESDLALWHITQALRMAVQSGRPHDRMY